jgi:hypothetical protein
MTTLAITRGGFGTVLRFPDDRSAYLHPVVQYGDAIARDPEALMDCYNRIEWPKIMRVAQYENQLLVDALDHLSPVEERAARANSCGELFRRLLMRAVDPPALPENLSSVEELRHSYARIFAMVAADRVSQDKELRQQMAAENTEDIAKTPKTGNLNPTTKLHFGRDKEGKAWGPDHCPYKPDSKRSARWALVKKGMTVLQAVEAGLPARYIEDMVEREFLVLHPVVEKGAPEPIPEQAAA